MSTSANEKARVEARKDISGHITPGGYEGALARVLAGLAATDKVREKRNEEAGRGRSAEARRSLTSSRVGKEA